MGVLALLRAWWRRRRWSRSDAPAAGGDGEEPGADYECAVCGTGVADPEGPCPLCRGTDVVPAGAGPGTGADGDGGTAETAEARAVERRVAAGEDGSVERLRALREEGDLLERYADCWQPIEGGFRVETAHGTREVGSREEVVALLRAEDG